ncbi:hypothetical protein BJX99DRAFT_228108 [Aspergillus californicus]
MYSTQPSPVSPRLQMWSEEERSRLWHCRQLHSHLPWREFHKLNFFPQRTDTAIYAEYNRMEKAQTRKRLQSSKDTKTHGQRNPSTYSVSPKTMDDPTKQRLQSGEPSKLTSSPLNPAKRPLVPTPENGQSQPSKQARLFVESDDESSNDEHGDIDNDGRTRPLQGYPLRSQKKPATPVSSLPPGRGQITPGTQQPERQLNTPLVDNPAAQGKLTPKATPEPSRPSRSPRLASCFSRGSSGSPSVSSKGTVPNAQNTNKHKNMTSSTPLSRTTSRESTRTPVPEVPSTISAPLPPKSPKPPTPAKSPVPEQSEKVAVSATEGKSPQGKVDPINHGLPNLAANYMRQCAQVLEQNSKLQTDREERLEAEVKSLRQTIDHFKEQVASQAKEIEEIRLSGVKEFAALTKQLEDVKEDTQKVLKFQDAIRGAA